jgi:phosphatidylglycerol lysyltransferase
LLRRHKFRAWAVTVLAYAFYFGVNSVLLLASGHRHFSGIVLVRGAVLPIVLLILLIGFRRDFIVQSEARSYAVAARFSALILGVALLYGFVGFTLLDHSDFHREITPATAAHYTVDQLGITNMPLHPYTRRAHIFVDSLSLISVLAITYVIISFFEPLRLRYADQSTEREHLLKLLEEYPAHSEDYFKLWPHDKQYFFDHTTTSGLAYHVHRGVALILGDPVGNSRQFEALLQEFERVCYINDWLPGWLHVLDTHEQLFEKHGYTMQKIGEEAVVHLEPFLTDVVRNKYFRHIRNKFVKQGFTAELLAPPHHTAIKDRLQQVSNDWLARGGRVERGFVMGYYSEAYIDNCPIMVVRDAAGTIQAFLNLIPAPFDPEEATFDLLRHTDSSPGNINDFLLINFAEYCQTAGYSRLNLGLCPLVGLEDEEAKSLPDTVLRFAYANGDRFYSFSGLHRFKSKYEPEWRDRYSAYKGGVRGFTRIMTALVQTVKVR